MRTEYRIVELLDAPAYFPRYRLQIAYITDTDTVVYASQSASEIHGNTMYELKNNFDKMAAGFEKPVIERKELVW